VGYTIDRVRGVDVITDFYKTPSQLLDTVVSTERLKDGIISSDGLSAKESTKDGIPAYDLEYTVSSTRGNNRFFVKASIANKKLVVATVQVPEAAINDDFKTTALHTLESLSIKGLLDK